MDRSGSLRMGLLTVLSEGGMSSLATTTIRLQEQSSVRSILGTNVISSSYDEVVRNGLLWGKERQSCALFFANVHMLMEAFDDRQFQQRINRANMINPDGIPIVWTLKALGEGNAQRVYGPDATVAMLTAAEKADMSVGFYGGSQTVLEKLIRIVRERHPKLRITFQSSPPFRTITTEEDADVTYRIAASGTQLLFVGLGCPKQENWIIDHLDKIPAVMFGVGAAFDFIAGTKPQAPRWMMRSGLEWVFRFVTEPRRLAKRYLKHNPRFVGLILWELVARG